MDKLIGFIGRYKHAFKPVCILSTAVGLICGGWLNILPAVVVALLLLIMSKTFYPPANLADANYWVIKKDLLDRVLPEYEALMESRGYARKDYRPEVHDCDDYATAGRAALHELLLKERKNCEESTGRADAVFLFSFRRDDGPRHRLLLVLTDQGRVYIDNWRMNGSFYRNLSIKEEANGVVV